MEDTPEYGKKRNDLAIGYVRVSTSGQAESGLSIDAQEREVRGYCSRHRLDLVSIISDPGETGSNLKRPGVLKVISLCSCRQISHVVVWHSSRLTRCTRDLLNIVHDIFDYNGVKLHLISQNIDTRTSMGKLQLTMLGAIDQNYRDQISENTIRALRQKRLRGEPLGMPPYGYEAGEGVWYQKNREQMKVIRRIRRLRNAGKTLKEITEILNSAGIAAPVKEKWNPGTIRYILRNKNYRELSRQNKLKKARSLSVSEIVR